MNATVMEETIIPAIDPLPNNKMNNEKKYIDYYVMENATHVFDSEYFVRRAFKYNKKATDFSKNKIIDFIKSSSSK